MSARSQLSIRQLDASDSFESLTDLLHHAYGSTEHWNHTNYRSVLLSKKLGP
jgi:hypothetical protein